MMSLTPTRIKNKHDRKAIPDMQQGTSPPSTLPSSSLLQPEKYSGFCYLWLTEKNRKRTTLVFFASSSTFLFVGSVYGWGPMQLLLEENGNFGTDCVVSEMEATVCPEQTAALLNCRFISQLALLVAPLMGRLSDEYGGTTLTFILGASTLSALSLMMVAVQFPATKWDSLLYVACALLGFGATSGGMLTVKTGLLFRDPLGKTTSQSQSRVISLLNALFDAGATTYLGLWWLEKITVDDSVRGDSTTGLTAILGGYLVAGIFFLGSYMWFYYQVDKDVNASEEENTESNPAKIEMSFHSDRITETENTPPRFLSSTLIKASHDSTTGSQTPTTIDDGGYMTPRQLSRVPALPDEEECDNDERPIQQLVAPEPMNPENASYVPISQRTTAQQLTSRAYIMLCVLFSFHMVSNVWTLTTARDFLKHLGDDEYGNRYLSIFTLMAPVSLMALPFEDAVIHRYGFGWGLQVVNLLGMIHCIVKVVSPNLNVQILGFVVFSFFRCFLFAVTFSCLASFTSCNATGRAVGIIYVVSGVASFVNIGLANLAVERLDGNFFIPNLLFVVLTIPAIYAAHLIGLALERDNHSKAKTQSQSFVMEQERDDDID